MAEQPRGINEGIEILQNILALIVGFGAVLSASGYVAVHSYLSLYSDAPYFPVNSNHYLVAGFGMLVMFSTLAFTAWVGTQLAKLPGWIHREFLSKKSSISKALGGVLLLLLGVYVIWSLIQPSGLLTVILVLLTWVSFAFVFVLSYTEKEVGEPNSLRFVRILAEPGNAIREMLKRPFSAVSLYVALVIFAYCILFGIFFGRVAYGNLPTSIGGGKPGVVELVFNADDELGLLQLTLIDERTTAPICVLVTLSSGVLVYDPQNQHTVLVKNDSILGSVDDGSTVNCNPPVPRATN